MTEEQYARWTAPLRAHPRATRALLAANKLLTVAGYVAYPLLLVLLAVAASEIAPLAGSGAAGAGVATSAEAIAGSSAGAAAAGSSADVLGGAGAGAAEAGVLGDTGALGLSPAWRLFESCVIVPAMAFVAVSVFRRIFNAPRPYEVLAIEPLISKDTRGKSFPSRHTFSMFTIACAWWQLEPAVGVALGAAGAAMGAVRVLGGMHFPHDVVAGALSAVVLSAAGYALFAFV